MDTKQRKISFLLGSGFSVPAAIPCVPKINKYLTNLKCDDFIVYDDCIAFPQSTKGNAVENFGVESVEEINRQFVVKFISWYKDYYLKNINKIFDYEDLFDDIQFFLLGPQRDKEFQSFFDSFVAENTYSRKGYEPFPSFQIIISWLISHKFYLEINNDIIIKYSSIVAMVLELLQNEYQIAFHTLNHDCLLEGLLTHANIDFCDGFSLKSNWKYRNMETNEIKDILHFDNAYSENSNLCNIYKIHGSIDYYSSENDVFKTKEYPRLSQIIPQSNDLTDEDKPSFEMGPFYFTGKELKICKYSQFNFTISQLDNFKQNLERSSLLIVIGYGFQDQRINDIIGLSKCKTIICDIKKPAQVPLQNFVLIEKSADKLCYSDISKRLSEISMSY